MSIAMNPTEIEKGQFSGLVPNEYITMPDGARWRQFEIQGGIVILTSSGNELFHDSNAKEIFDSLRQYRLDISQRRQSGEARQYLANGGNGEIYTVAGHQLVVKESRSNHSLYYALQRMDTLARVIETHLPHWVSLPAHYGLISSSQVGREYMLIEKIDEGLSLEDLVQYVERGSARSKTLTDAIHQNYRGLNSRVIESLKLQFQEFKTLLRRYLDTPEAIENGYTYDSLLPDPNYGNILVEKLRTPIGGKHFKMWIIDQ